MLLFGVRFEQSRLNLRKDETLNLQEHAYALTLYFPLLFLIRNCFSLFQWCFWLFFVRILMLLAIRCKVFTRVNCWLESIEYPLHKSAQLYINTHSGRFPYLAAFKSFNEELNVWTSLFIFDRTNTRLFKVTHEFCGRTLNNSLMDFFSAQNFAHNFKMFQWNTIDTNRLMQWQKPKFSFSS